MLKRSMFIALTLAVFGFASATETRAQLNLKGTGAFGGCVSDAYQIAYGRSASPPELGNWRKAGFDESDCRSDEKERLIEKLKAIFRTGAGYVELNGMITRCYKHSFAREPKAGDLKYWITEIQINKKNLGYSELMNAQRQWLKDEKNQADRTYAIYQAYLNGIGRAPYPGDLEYWRNKMTQDGSNYTDCLKANIAYILGSTQAQAKEFSETVKRAYAKAGLQAPTSDQIAQIRVKIQNRKLDFNDMVEFVKKANNAALSSAASSVTLAFSPTHDDLPAGGSANEPFLRAGLADGRRLAVPVAFVRPASAQLPAPPTPAVLDFSMRQALYLNGAETKKVDTKARYVTAGKSITLKKGEAAGCAGDTCTVNLGLFAFRNTAEGSFSTYALIRGETLGIVGNTVTFQPGSKVKDLVLPAKLKVGENKLIIEVDPYKKTAETNEDNNLFEVTIVVEP